EMVKPFSDPEVIGVQGAYKTKQKEFCARFIQLEIEDRYEKIMKSKKIDWMGSYSAAYRRDAFFEVQGYDESFPTASGEDPELSFKLAKKGYKLAFNPNAIVFHKHDTSFFDYFKKKFFRAYWRVLLYKKHSDKMIKDSYTPQVLKLQIILFYLFIIFPVLGVLVLNLETQLIMKGEMTILFLGFLTTLPFLIKAMQKDIALAAISPFIFCIRAAAFGTGLMAGIIKGVWNR
ncbi:MAG: glycosyltransferase family 2 protein, partial [Candidatus Diapherotrites archaeon]|nr:glycosyltransferase family 2 protein [Candidatus Diapherotrites archaeon]